MNLLFTLLILTVPAKGSLPKTEAGELNNLSGIEQLARSKEIRLIVNGRIKVVRKEQLESFVVSLPRKTTAKGSRNLPVFINRSTTGNSLNPISKINDIPVHN